MLKTRLVLKGLQNLKSRTEMACLIPNLLPPLRIFGKTLCPFGSPLMDPYAHMRPVLFRPAFSNSTSDSDLTSAERARERSSN